MKKCKFSISYFAVKRIEKTNFVEKMSTYYRKIMKYIIQFDVLKIVYLFNNHMMKERIEINNKTL